MRPYATVSPTFWTGQTGRALTKLSRDSAAGADAQRLAFYLITSPHATMLGLYYLPLAYCTTDTGLDEKRLRKALTVLTELGFSQYDPETHYVWVVEFARFQIGPQLHPGDKRIPMLNRLYHDLPHNRWLGGFFDRYADAFHLQTRRCEHTRDAPSMGHRRGIEAPSEGHKCPCVPVPVLGVLPPASDSALSSSEDGEGCRGGEGPAAADGTATVPAEIPPEPDVTPAWVVERWNAIQGVEPFNFTRYFNPEIGVGKKLLARVKQHDSPQWWLDYFTKIQQSNWLVESFHPHLDWGLEPRNIQKVLQGNYIKTLKRPRASAYGRIIDDLQAADERPPPKPGGEP